MPPTTCSSGITVPRLISATQCFYAHQQRRLLQWITVAIADNAGFTGNVLDDLPENVAGETFWVRITDNVDPSSSCFTDLDETIVDDPDEIIVTNATVTDSDQCSPSNGAIEVTAITINGAATNSAAGFEALETAGYTFDVLQSDATTLEKTFNIAADGGTGTSLLLTDWIPIPISSESPMT